MGILNRLFESTADVAKEIKASDEDIIKHWKHYLSTVARKKEILEHMWTSLEYDFQSNIDEVRKLLELELVDISSEEKDEAELISDLERLEHSEKIRRVHRLEECLGYAATKYEYVYGLLMHLHTILKNQMHLVKLTDFRNIEKSIFQLKLQLNLELEILKKIDEIQTFSTVDAFDNEKLDLSLQIPQDAKEKIYYLEFSVLDEDNEIFQNDYDDDESKFSQSITLSGNCAGSSSTALISASLISGGKAGEELTIKATITNSGSNSATYTVNAAGYTSWASLTSVDPSTIIVNSGESKEVLFKFKVNSDAVGEQTFNIEALSGTNQVISQSVQVTIESSGFGGLGGNWYLWAIGALNVILVIVIIVIAAFVWIVFLQH